MGAQTTSSTTDGQRSTRAGRGRGAVLSVLTAALFSLSAGAAAASPVVTPPSPQHLQGEVSVSQSVVDDVCSGLTGVLPSAGAMPDVVCKNVNGWQ
ncbi:hypothetical protein RM572_12910 [Streptomyces sp. DSM 42041]|uniref:Uncharacterized protein n=1 Tax=Streptomyces hazeniae TaxID=3075538 RepID=A0ABU2NUK5_9ACTN|nr:hypothetical protein [Streptomyces sp. DSM 42041]MDT0379667.1 hypothetical protein [Streptomyces sp. DSM 42041]